jgi:hypothetical protein
MSGEIWIINGRCLDCVRAEESDPSERDTCGCWCHDTCPDCGRADCTGEDCYWPDEAGIQRPERPAPSAPGGAGEKE